ncbi:MAG: DUF881 domain-containing protein [Alicyclobacillaceae bacterium]|nr:DUF881 domain-containing protein [Alicyclobacillaceae bacterium]
MDGEAKRRNPRLVWYLTGIAAILGFMLTVQITNRPNNTTESGLASYLDLRSELVELSAEHKTIMSDIARQSAALAQFKAAEGSDADMRRALERDARSVAAQAGLTPVSGPGITVEIRDDPKLPFNQEYAGQFQQESDQILSQIVNDLFANGAEAISINGQRLVTTSSIRLVTNLSGTTTLQVNTYPVTPPYVIAAVGDVDHMRAALTVDDVVPLLQLMQEDCVIRVHPGPRGVTVPAYRGSLPGQWAKEVSHP